MREYTIKRAGRDYIVYAGSVQVLKCHSRREAKACVLTASGQPPKRLRWRAVLSNFLTQRRAYGLLQFW